VSAGIGWDARQPGRRGTRGGRGGVHRATHLFALSAFALAQPLFAKLGPAPGYFAAHRMTSTEVVLFAVALVAVPALVLLLLEAVARIFGRRVRWVVHLLLVAVLVALIALPPVGGLTSWLAYALAAVIGAGFAAAYARWQPVRAFTTVLGFAPLLFLAVFLFASPTAKMISGGQSDAWRADKSFRPPIVFIQFDALPGLLLETPEHQVDAVRFPNFARLARDGVWYRNASNVHENTVFSVPSFVDGRLPQKGTVPVVQDHYPNLFTLLGPGYRMNVSEEAANLCPYEFCRDPNDETGSIWSDSRIVYNQIIRPEDAREKLPSIRHRWTDYSAGALQASFATRKKSPAYVIRHLQSGRIGRFQRWLRRVGQGGARPELDYIHMFLPHEPREFLPGGQRYVSPDGALGGPPSYDSRFLSEQDEQRTILQLGYTDRILGQVIARLKRLGIYEDAFLIVVADHGESWLPPKPTPAGPFVPGHLGYRRAVTPRNLADIGSIPMFIKYPKGHGRPAIDDRFVRSVDVFPTIAQELSLALPPLDGRPLQNPHYRGHATVRVATTFDGVVRAPVRRWQRERRLSLARRLRRFGSGSRSLYAFGPHRHLVGRSVGAFEMVPSSGARATVDGARRLDNVSPLAPVCLCQMGGQIQGADPARMPLAIAVNGRIVATAEGFAARGVKKLNWAAMIPPRAYHDGRNQLEVFRIAGPRRLERLTPAGI
jgi:sulfatase-like protein